MADTAGVSFLSSFIKVKSQAKGKTMVRILFTFLNLNTTKVVFLTNPTFVGIKHVIISVLYLRI